MTSEDSKRFKFAYDSETGNYGALIDGEYYFFGGSSGIDISDTTAIASTVLSGYDFYTSDGTKTSGTITTRSAIDETISSSKTYSVGYYPNSWTVTSAGTDTNDATAYAKNIEDGYTAYCRGEKIVGACKGVVHGLVIDVTKESGISASFVNGAATTVGDYALFGGGDNNSGTLYSNMYAYDKYLTKSIANNLSTARKNIAATTVGNHALFGGGQISSSPYRTNALDAYNTNLTRTNPATLSQARSNNSAASTNDYALIGGGVIGDYSNRVDAFAKETLTRTIAAPLTNEVYEQSATQANNCVFFVGGRNTYNSQNNIFQTVNVYDNLLTKSTPLPFSGGGREPGATFIGNYAIIAGGMDASRSYTNVNTYDSSLVKSELANLTANSTPTISGNIETRAVFNQINMVNTYDKNFTKENYGPITVPFYSLKMATSINETLLAITKDSNYMFIVYEN